MPSFLFPIISHDAFQLGILEWEGKRPIPTGFLNTHKQSNSKDGQWWDLF